MEDIKHHQAKVYSDSQFQFLKTNDVDGMVVNNRES